MGTEFPLEVGCRSAPVGAPGLVGLMPPFQCRALLYSEVPFLGRPTPHTAPRPPVLGLAILPFLLCGRSPCIIMLEYMRNIRR